MSSLISLADVFNNWCQNIPKPNEDEEFWQKYIIPTYGFKLRVVVSKDIPSRHETFSWIRGMGVNKYDEIFQGDIILPDSWMLAFPERFCSLEEQSGLIHQLVKLNKKQGYPMKSLDIITQSPFIVSDSKSEIVSIISFKKGKKTYAQDFM